ncbi:MAG: oxidoreductase, partial [Pseudonocardiales bacterium]|nr:oxidoreductase [Pseudonocardiales bacterium]
GLDARNLVELTMVYTRGGPEGWPRRIGRVDAADIVVACWPPDASPTCYVCGPTAFVESAAGLLVAAGHVPDLIRTERFGSV